MVFPKFKNMKVRAKTFRFDFTREPDSKIPKVLNVFMARDPFLGKSFVRGVKKFVAILFQNKLESCTEFFSIQL